MGERYLIRGSFLDRIRVDLICGMKMHFSRKFVVQQICQERDVPKRFVMQVYNQCIRPRLNNGERIRDLF